MKKHITLALSVCLGLNTMAQNESDILITTRQAPTGTARSMGLNNAMGAIGGDQTAINFNPAGIGIYRGSEFVFTTGLQFNNTEGNYLGNKTDDNNTNFTLSQIGYVGTYPTGTVKKGGIVSTHIGFTYNRLNNFNQNIYLKGISPESSMLDMWALNANGTSSRDLEDGSSQQSLAYNAYLINEISDGSAQYDQVMGYIDNDGNYVWSATNGVEQTHIIERSGNGGEYAITGGLNIGNTLLVGASLNFQSINYEQSIYHEEFVIGGPNEDFFDPLESFEMYDTWTRQGTSTNLKLGLLFKPINAVRIGFAFHSPNWFHMHEEYYTKISAKYADDTRPVVAESDLINEFEYKLNTPIKLIGSFALVSKIGLISVDYEYQDYSTAEFKSYDSDFSYSDGFWDINQTTKEVFQPTHALRLGAELRVSSIQLRCGAGFYSSPYKQEYVSEPMLTKSVSTGIGYRNENFFIDAGYMAILQNEDYFPYNYDANDPNNSYLIGSMPPPKAEITSATHNFMLTMGFKF